MFHVVFVGRGMVMVICSGNVLFPPSSMFGNFLNLLILCPLIAATGPDAYSGMVGYPWATSFGDLASFHLERCLGAYPVDFGGAWTPPDYWDAADIALVVVDDGVRQGVHSKASTLMWRSARCKRAVNSTLAGETIAMSAALADAEWAQIMIQDVLDQTVTVRNTTGGTLPFQVVLRSNCTLSKRLPHDHSIDAKSVFDALIKECAGNRQDRRTTVDLAIVRETLKAQGSHIRWIPHPLMPADSMTKADPSAGNDALRHSLRTGKLVWDEETIR